VGDQRALECHDRAALVQRLGDLAGVTHGAVTVQW
jgi:hypothetical protein